MAHLLILRCCNSLIQGKNLKYGVHQTIEQEINKRKYEINAVRKGYNIPFQAEWHFMDYRIKKECIPQFAKDLLIINLNPTPNTIKLKDVLFDKTKTRSIGKTFKFIQWTFKWINKKRLTATILSIIGILIISPFLLFLATIVLINPIKPVEVSQKPDNKFVLQWNYNFCFGQLTDLTIKDKNGYTQEDVL